MGKKKESKTWGLGKRRMIKHAIGEKRDGET